METYKALEEEQAIEEEAWERVELWHTILEIETGERAPVLQIITEWLDLKKKMVREMMRKKFPFNHNQA